MFAVAAYNDEPFEVAGNFWLPSDPTNRISGILGFNPEDGGTLSLIGMLTRPLGVFSDEVRALNIVLGEATDGKEYTLEGCRVTRQSFSPFRDGGGSERLSVVRIIEGAWFDGQTRAQLDRLYITYTYLEEWTGINGIVSTRPEKMSDDSYEVRLHYKEISSHTCRLPNSGTLALDHRVSHPYAAVGNQSYEQRVTASFRFNDVLSLDEALQVASDFQDLLTIANGRVVAFEAVRFGHPDIAHETEDGSRRRLDGRLYARWVARSNVSKTRTHTAHDMYFTFNHLGGMPGVQKWLSTARRFRFQLDRVAATKYGRGHLLHDILLARVAALESFHKKRYPKRLGVNSKKGTPRDLYLSERLDQLIEDAGRPFLLLFGSKRSEALLRVAEWRDRAKDERNSVAHHLSETYRDIEQIYYISEAAYYLFIIVMLRASRAPRAVFEHIVKQQAYQFAGKHLQEFL